MAQYKRKRNQKRRKLNRLKCEDIPEVACKCRSGTSFRSVTRSSSSSRTKSSCSSTRENERGPIENLVLHYLSALTNYFKTDKNDDNHPEPHAREGTADTFKRENSGDSEARAFKDVTQRMEPSPDMYSSKNKTILNQQESDTRFLDAAIHRRKRAYNIVLKAIDYGVNQGIVTKSGKHFWFKWDKRIKHRRKGAYKRKRKSKSKSRSLGRRRAKITRRKVHRRK